MKIIKYLQYFFVLLGLFAVVFLIFSRYEAESQLDTVEICAEDLTYEDLAIREGKDFKEFLFELKKAGFHSVMVNEMNFSQLDLSSDFNYTSFSDLTTQIGWQNRLPDALVDYVSERGGRLTYLLETGDRELYELICRNLDQKYGSEIFWSFSEEQGGEGTKKSYYIVIHGDYALRAHETVTISSEVIKRDSYEHQIKTLGLGFDLEKIRQINEAGMKAVLRLSNYQIADARRQWEYYKSIFESEIDVSKAFAFAGVAAAGTDKFGTDVTSEMSDYFLQNGFSLIMFEAEDQLGFYEFKGDRELAQKMNYNVVRLYNVPEFIRKRMNYLGLEGPKEIENSIYRAITDRNIGMVMLRPIFQSQDWYVSDMSVYRQLIDGVENRLTDHRIRLGDFGTLGKTFYSKWLYLFILYALASLFMLSVKKIYYNRHLDAGVTLFYVLLFPLLLYKMEHFVISASSFFSTVFFPVFSIFIGMSYVKFLIHRMKQAKHPCMKNIVCTGVTTFVLITGLTLAGAFFTAALLSRIEYLLEFSHFRGVKLSLVIPAIFSIPIYFYVFGFFTEEKHRFFNTVKRLMKADVKVYMLIAVCMVGVVALFYLTRSGNTGKTSSGEELFRIFLENTLLVRPRNKEFLLAFPALFIAIYLALKGYKNYILPFIIAAMLGLSSIQNSFCHTRTPIRISFYRSIISMGISILIGIAIILFFELMRIVITKYIRRVGRQ